MGNEFVAIQQFFHFLHAVAVFNLWEGDQDRTRKLGNLILIGIAAIQQHEICCATIQQLFQFLHSHVLQV